MKRTKEELTAMMEEEMRLAGWHKKKFEEHLDRALALANKKMGIPSEDADLSNTPKPKERKQLSMNFVDENSDE